MATMYKTPGVFLEEIPKFPPSIAVVETAIPAFIGYTEKADQISPEDLVNVPTKISSLTEYEFYFGGPKSPGISKVTLDDNNNFKSANISQVFYMYDSLRLFYANGGGDCYIVSTGLYNNAAKNKSDFIDDKKGITTLEKVDEPTILLFPDNSLLPSDDFYIVYDFALAQCGKLMDRVGLFHVEETDSLGQTFRSKTGVKDLKYGAAYSPWLKVNFPKAISYRDVSTVIHVGSANRKLSDLTANPAITALINNLEQVMKDSDAINASANGLFTPEKSLREKFVKLETAFLTAKDVNTFTAITKFLFDIARKADVLIGSATGKIENTELKTAVGNAVQSGLKNSYNLLIQYEKELAASAGLNYTVQFSIGTPPGAVSWGGIFAGTQSASTLLSDPPPVANTVDAKLSRVFPKVKSAFEDINRAWMELIAGSAFTLERTLNNGLIESFPLYKSIITGIQNASTSVPPSGAVAGIYAYVDRTRGVWKAPANVSITGIIGPTTTFTASQLDSMNVDPVSGKSINAIRSFTGRGTLVYGARTLAGNDSEWRYVSVRRLFNMVEESTKKAAEQFVFEPNDANTWVRVQAMIENFLTVLWRNGALQGAKPEHAFYVAVGLNKTMNAQDILDGNMIVEIGLAVARPAEFIVLRFSHMMAQS